MQIKTDTKRQVVDITDEIQSGLSGDGIAVVLVQHTTSALTTADLDPGTDLDFLDFLEQLTPQLDWRHPHDPAHTPDHLLPSLIGTSLTIPFIDGQLQLGAWQRVVLVEFDGPRDRSVLVRTLS